MKVSEKIRSFIVDSFYAPTDLADDASLLDTGTIDSTGVLELIVFLEQRFGITVGDAEIHPENFDSIQRIAAFVERKQKERAEISAPLHHAREPGKSPLANGAPPPLGGRL